MLTRVIHVLHLKVVHFLNVEQSQQEVKARGQVADGLKSQFYLAANL
jgi:hypothetical protein